MKQEEKLCVKVEVRELTYLGGMVSAGGRCESAVTARARFWLAKFRECGELLYGKMFSLRLKVVTYNGYVDKQFFIGGEAWHLK